MELVDRNERVFASAARADGGRQDFTFPPWNQADSGQKHREAAPRWYARAPRKSANGNRVFFIRHTSRRFRLRYPLRSAVGSRCDRQRGSGAGSDPDMMNTEGRSTMTEGTNRRSARTLGARSLLPV